MTLEDPEKAFAWVLSKLGGSGGSSGRERQDWPIFKGHATRWVQGG